MTHRTGDQRHEADLPKKPDSWSVRQRRRSFLRAYPWALMVGLAIAAVVLVYVGQARYFAAAGERRSLLDIIYCILCLFVVESGDVSGSVPWEWALARVLAPLLHAGQEFHLLLGKQHARWNAERWLVGWTLGPRDHAAKTSPYLVGWDELSEDIKDYDRAPVRNIPTLLNLIGGKVYRRPARGINA